VEAHVLLSRLNTVALLVNKQCLVQIDFNLLVGQFRERCAKLQFQFHMKILYCNVNLQGFFLTWFLSSQEASEPKAILLSWLCAYAPLKEKNKIPYVQAKLNET
jgi:hypothetical protein